MTAVRKIIDERKLEWRKKLEELNGKISSVEDQDNRRSLQEKSTRISRKILAYNGEPIEYPEINGLISELSTSIKLTQTIEGWQKRVNALHEKVVLLGTDKHQRLDTKIQQINKMIGKYSGETRQVEEIENAISALDTDLSRLKILVTIEDENLRRQITSNAQPVTIASDQQVTAAPTKTRSSGLRSFLSFFCCCCDDTGEAEPLLHQQKSNSLRKH